MSDLIGPRRPQICVDLAIVGAFEGPRTHKQLFSDESSSNLRHINVNLCGKRFPFTTLEFSAVFSPAAAPPMTKLLIIFHFAQLLVPMALFWYAVPKIILFGLNFQLFLLAKNFSLVFRRSSQVQCIFNLFLAAVHIFLTVRVEISHFYNALI